MTYQEWSLDGALLLRVQWHDLLSVPFLDGGDDPNVGLDCWGQAREVARRAGKWYPGMRTHDELRASFKRVDGIIEVAYLLVSDPTKKGYPSHVAVIVDAPRGLALSTSERAGAFCWPLHRAPKNFGIWRLA